MESVDKNYVSYNEALGTIKKGLDRHLQLLLGHPAAIELRISH